MCELLGISIHPSARLGLDFGAFRRRAAHHNNHHGWGIAWWTGGDAEVHKEADRADESALAAQLAADPPTSSTFIVHVRAATVGRVALENSHPFSAVQQGRHWVFAHNGTIQGAHDLPVGDRVAQGDTDSEMAFLHLLHRMGALGDRPADDEVERLVGDFAVDMTARGKCNFLLSDGTTLFGYYDGHKSLHILSRSAADLHTITVADDDYRLDLDVQDAPEERAVVLASVPLSDEPWRPLEPGSMVVCRDGRPRIRSLVQPASTARATRSVPNAVRMAR